MLIFFQVSEIKRNVVGLREKRPFMLADAISHEEHEDIKDLCTLKVGLLFECKKIRTVKN